MSLASEVFLQTPVRVDKVFTQSTGVTVSYQCSFAEINQALLSMKILLLVGSVCNNMLIVYY